MTKLLSTVVAVFCLLCASGQTQYSTESISLTSFKPSDWTVYFFDENNIKIEYKVIACDYTSGLDEELVLFKVTNLGNTEMNVKWHAQLKYNDICRTCADPMEYSVESLIPVGQSVEGICDRSIGFGLRVFSGFTDPNYAHIERLTSFELADLTITN